MTGHDAGDVTGYDSAAEVVAYLEVGSDNDAEVWVREREREGGD